MIEFHFYSYKFSNQSAKYCNHSKAIVILNDSFAPQNFVTRH